MEYLEIPIYKCSKKAVVAMKENGECYIQGFGGSMEPILHSGETFHFQSVTEETRLSEGDIVFCEVNGELLLHKIIAINGKRIQIGNNKGKVNGWTTKERIFGKYIKTVDLQSGREMSVYPAE